MVAFCWRLVPMRNPDVTLKAHSHHASTPTLSVHTPILFPIFDVMLKATLMLAKWKTAHFIQGTLLLR